MDLSTGDLSTWLPTPSLLPRGPQAEGLEGAENARFASFGHGIWGVGGREWWGSRHTGVWDSVDSRAGLLTPASLPGGSRVTVLRLHRSAHGTGSCVSSLHHPVPHEQAVVLTAQQSLTQWSSHHVGSHSRDRKFSCFISPCQYQFNTPSFLYFSKSVPNFIQESCDNLPTTTGSIFF